MILILALGVTGPPLGQWGMEVFCLSRVFSMGQTIVFSIFHFTRSLLQVYLPYLAPEPRSKISRSLLVLLRAQEQGHWQARCRGMLLSQIAALQDPSMRQGRWLQ